MSPGPITPKFIDSPMMFCQLQPGSRLSQDEETATYLVPGGAVRRESSRCRTARRKQGRAALWRGVADPCFRAPFCYSELDDGRRSGNQIPVFPVVGSRVFS